MTKRSLLLLFIAAYGIYFCYIGETTSSLTVSLLVWQGHDDSGGRGATGPAQSAGGAHDFIREARARAQVTCDVETTAGMRDHEATAVDARS